MAFPKFEYFVQGFCYIFKFLRSYSNNKYCVLKSAIQDKKSAVNLTLPLSFYVYCLDLLTYKNDTTFSPPLIFLFNEESLKICSNILQHKGHIFLTCLQYYVFQRNLKSRLFHDIFYFWLANYVK